MASRLVELESHVARLDAALLLAEPREVSALLRERRLTLGEVESLRGVGEGSKIDELARRRSDRRAAANVDAKSGGGC